MSSVNHPEDIQHIYDIVSDNVNKIPNKTREEKNRLVSKIILRLREGVFKSHVIVGFPKVNKNAYICQHELITDSSRPLMLFKHYPRLLLKK